jgi:ribose 5-phosphate isomerase A
MTVEAQKREAAAKALEFVRPGMRLGLGTGSTAKHFVELLAERVRAGLDVVGVPTSAGTHELASSLGVPLATLDAEPELDLTVDGADEVDPELNLIKGGGAALLREKIVAAASRSMIVIADESKMVASLGKFPLPIEIVKFGMAATQRAIESRCTPEVKCRLRHTSQGHALVTDEGHFILDAPLQRIDTPAELAACLSRIAGVVEHGLFIGMADLAVISSPEGVRVVERRTRRN